MARDWVTGTILTCLTHAELGRRLQTTGPSSRRSRWKITEILTPSIMPEPCPPDFQSYSLQVRTKGNPCSPNVTASTPSAEFNLMPKNSRKKIASWTCPHCSQQTKLSIGKEALLSIAQDKSKPIEERVAAFKARMVATKPEREARLKELEEYLKKDATTAIIWSKLDELELAGDKVVIRRRGIANMLASGLNGERMINISTLTGIQMKPQRRVILTRLHFVLVRGEQAIRRRCLRSHTRS